MLLPNHAIAVFSNSATPNWKIEQCKDPPPQPPLTEYELSLINAILDNDPNNANNNANNNRPIGSFAKGVYKIVSEINHKNKDIVQTHWNGVTNIFQTYQQVSGLQMWVHKFYEEKKCFGPYIADWACCKVAGKLKSR